MFFGVLKKALFKNNFFFFEDLEESGQSKVCRASDGRNFGTKYVGIEALWPRFYPDRKMTRSRPMVRFQSTFAIQNQYFCPNLVSFDWKLSEDVPFLYDQSEFRGSLTRYNPPNSKMIIFGCFWIFRQLRSFHIWKSKIYILRRNRPALIWYQNYRDWTGLSLVMIR